MKLETLLNVLPAETSPADKALIQKAYEAAEVAHSGQKRASGEPYVQHCLNVAYILAELRMPTAVLVAGLLHDTVEDTAYTLDDVRANFGPEVAVLVDGVTKLAQLPRVSKDGNTPIDRHAESLRKTFMAMSDDVRVVLIKLADRLHNMRTLMHVKPEKQARIARETLEIFAPLANRLGIWSIKSELEDLSFRYTNPARFREIAGHIAEQQADREQTMAAIVAQVREALKSANIEAEVSGRPKHIYSIYKKMERKEVDFDQVFDVRAVRIIVKDNPTCYHVLGVIHNLWRPVPGQFDDYIATPKDNFYQSLHTAVKYDDGKTLEVQIRTPEMHANAEYGIAAHWRYKEGVRHDEAYERRIQWLRSLMEWRQDVADSVEFVDALKTEVLEERVYAFTPRGDIIDLPAGATPIDFAYRVHTSIGDRCRGAKVNGKLVSLDYRLKTGEQVEIVTAKRGGPSRDWLNPDLGLVRTHRAVQKIRQYFRRQNRELLITQGRELLEKELKRLGIETYSFDALARMFEFAKPEELLFALGAGDIHGRQIAARLMEAEREAAAASQVLPAVDPRGAVQSGEVAVLGTKNLLTNLARCCKPVPGDPIIGYITRGRGATIHRQDCPNVLYHKEPERIIKVSWGQAQQTYPVLVRILAYDRGGLMKDISTVVAEEHINMTAISVATKNSLATFEVTMEIADTGVLSRVLARIEQLPNVIEARRWKAG
ncbi:MAG: bifunctional (p)ppGpp synthetase/guanosine-3',5'-bis(diphosphate) 3'-pyrophosphohydrolase [Anaerolineales bacterium]|nr:bifunctional (p)ppGpp synthetase/guanosine-3',5'-bis(diphosphate) 3'-pyrophosphohydrolase [Anaerolineales bacterium]